VIFNKHSALVGQHAFLSASKPAWVNYDEDKLTRAYMVAEAAARGTRLHDLAHRLIRDEIWLPENDQTLSLYVNDAIGFKMTPEQILYYSEHCYGTADTICFRNNKLRIHDLKTGVNHTSEAQLKVYSALFCLEYKHRPFDIEIELRIYQNNVVRIYEPEPDEIFHIIDKIVTFSKHLESIREEALS
jgi:hypothetical protein